MGLPPITRETQIIDVPYRDIYIILQCCGGLVMGTTTDSLVQAVLAFKDKYPLKNDPSIGFFTQLRNYNPNHVHDWAIYNFRQRCKYIELSVDWDQTNPKDIFIRQFEYLEAHPDVFIAGVKINKRCGTPLSFNRGRHNIPLWLPPDSEGVIHTDYIAFNLSISRIAMFDRMIPPYFKDRFAYVDGGAFRVDGINTFNHKMQEAGLKKVILDIKCGHTSWVENPALENNEYVCTIAQQKYIK